MTTTVKAYGAVSATEPLVPLTIERREVGPHDIAIDIKYAGICHSDIHTVRSEWAPVQYPLTPGHEIAGFVTAVGSEVKGFKVGDRAGVGCMVNSCQDCSNCARGEEQFCSKGMIQTYGSLDKDGTITQGGYATAVVVDEKFVVHIPEAIPLDQAAPLLCAGITTYSPLKHWGAGPGKKVAIIGLGGLGHMAVKIAHAMGAEVTVLSQSLKKMEDGLKLGADHYYATSDPATFATLYGTFDIILSTVSAPLNFDAYLSLLKEDGSLVNVGIPSEPISFNAFSVVMGRKSISGSIIGGIRETQEMLDFCAEHHIGAEVEIIPASKINEAYERVLASDVRYRFVIDTSTL